MSKRWWGISVLAFVLMSASCEKQDATTGIDGSPPATLTLSRTSGTPASVVSVTGYEVDPSRAADITVQLGAEEAVHAISEDGSLTFIVPLFLDSSGWPSPPATRLQVKILLDGSVVAATESGFLVEPLPHAPGSTAEIQQAAAEVVAGLDSLWTSLPVADEEQRVVRQAVVEMMKALVEDGDSSLAAIVDGTSSLWQGQPPDLELVDAILAASGVLDMYRALAAGLSPPPDSGAVGVSLSPRPDSAAVAADMPLGENPYCDYHGDSGPDLDLACQMQMHVVLKDYTEMVVIPTMDTWNHTVGLASPVLSLTGAGKVADIIGALLTVESFIMDKIVVATLPSHIQTFMMTTAGDTIGVDELTNTSLLLSAANTPVPMTVNDFVTLLVAGLPFLDTPSLQEDFTKKLLEAAAFAIDQYRGKLLAYEQAHPGTFDDIALVSIPPMIFGPVEVTHSDLVQLLSEDPSIAAPDESAVEWRGVTKGQTVIRAQTRAAGDRSTVVIAWRFLTTYAGGAFGVDVAATHSHTITVYDSGLLEVVVQGLPADQLANIQVTPSSGSGSTPVTGTTALTDLEPGVYTIEAFEVETESDGPYVPEPMSQSVEVVADSTATVTITYEPKFGNIYLVVTGLFEGEEGELPADIRVEGPDGFVRQITGTTLIDSLTAGTYDVFAFEVDDGFGQTYVPEPDVSELVVEGANTTALTIAHHPKFGTMNLQVRNLPDGVDADIDIVGPDGFFHHSTRQEQIDSLLAGEYIVNAYEVVDVNGDTITPSPTSQAVTITPAVEEVAWVDYSGGHDLTVSFTGLPTGAAANYAITGPEGYSATISSDTILTGLPDGGSYVLQGQDIEFNGVAYRPAPRDTTFSVFTDKTIDLQYRGISTMSALLGGLRSNTSTPRDDAQLLVRASSVSATSDTTITDIAFAPDRGAFPEQLVYDSCNFESGRLLLGGAYPYQAEASTPFGDGSVTLTLDVQDTIATLTFDGSVRIIPPSDPQNNGWADIRIDLSRLLQVIVDNPNDPSVSSYASMSAVSRVEVMNPNDGMNVGIYWNQAQHLCQGTSNNITVLDYSVPQADTLQAFERSTGGYLQSGQRKEFLQTFYVTAGGYARAGDPVSEVTIHGTLEFRLRQN